METIEIVNASKDNSEGDNIFCVRYRKNSELRARWVMAKTAEEASEIVKNETPQIMRYDFHNHEDGGEMVKDYRGEYVEYDSIKQYLPDHLRTS